MGAKVKRGQKACPKCQFITGVRSHACPFDSCDHVYKAGISTAIKDKGVGRGKKRCPYCEAIIGARSFDCGCGYNFKTQVVTPKPPTFAAENPNYDLITDWEVLKKGDEIEVLPETGDYYLDSYRNKVYMGEPGRYTVIRPGTDGLVVHGENGFSYVYLGPPCMSSVVDCLHKEASLIAKVG